MDHGPFITTGLRPVATGSSRQKPPQSGSHFGVPPYLRQPRSQTPEDTPKDETGGRIQDTRSLIPSPNNREPTCRITEKRRE